MRGLVLKETTLNLPSLHFTAIVLFVSGRNDLCSGGAPNSDGAPERTSSSDRELESGNFISNPLDPNFSSRVATGVNHLPYETPTAWFGPDVVSATTAQVPVPSGSNSESAPEWTSANNHGVDFHPFMDLVNLDFSPQILYGADYPPQKPLSPCFGPDVVSATTAQVPVPSGTKRSHSGAEGKPVVKKAWRNTLQEPCSSSNAGSNTEAATAGIDGCRNVVELSRYPAQAAVANTVQQQVVLVNTALKDSTDFGSARREPPSMPMRCEDGMDLKLWSESSGNGYNAGEEGAKWDHQVAFCTEPSDFAHQGSLGDATAPTLVHISAPVPPADTNTAQQPNEEWVQDTFSLGKFQSIPSQQEESLSSVIADALTSLLHSTQDNSQDQPSADVSHSETVVSRLEHSETLAGHSEDSRTSGSLLGFSCDAGNDPEQTLEPSASISSGVSPQPLPSGPPRTVESLPERPHRARDRRKSSVYNAARKLLVSSEGVSRVQRIPLSLMSVRTRTRRAIADAPYVSSSWLLMRLLHHDTVPNYLIELQTAFECYGYDNIPVLNVWQRALELAYTVKKLRTKYCILEKVLSLAAKIVRDAFFRGHAPRSDLKTYLQHKIRVQNAGDSILPVLRGSLWKLNGDVSRMTECFNNIRRALNPEASSVTHPLNFISFFTDLDTLVRNIDHVRKMVEESSASTSKKQPENTSATQLDVGYNKVTEIVTKYKKLFKLDLATEIEALLKAAPQGAGLALFETAVKEGYVPFDLLQPDPPNKRYSVNAHCILGSVTALYRRLFESTNETSNLEADISPSSSDFDAIDSDASVSDTDDGGSNLDVVQQYLLHQWLTANRSTVKEPNRENAEGIGLLPAASEILALWRRSNFLPNISPCPRIPEEIVPFRSSCAPYGTAPWILAQLAPECCPGEHERQCDEFKFAIDVGGHETIGIRDVFANAFALATAILTNCEVPFDNLIEQSKLSRTLKAYLLAADLIQVALFPTSTQHQGLPGECAKQVRYEAYQGCVREVLTEREELHPIQGNGKKVVTDWSQNPALVVEIVDHPLSFDSFWKDVQLINQGNNLAIPEIAAKYKSSFNRDIVGDLKFIREHHGKSVGEGAGESSNRYAELPAEPASPTVMVNNSALLLLEAYVNYYLSLIGPTDATVSQGTSTQGDIALAQTVGRGTLLIGSAENVDLRPGPTEERRAQPMAIVDRASAQKTSIAEVVTTEPSQLHPVARYLLGYL